MVASRLQDPDNLVDGRTLESLREKMSAVMTRMVKLPQNGGNAFLFALSAPKPHLLADELPGHRKDPRTGEATFTTAATDGVSYFWSPKFLASLDYDEATFVMFHEAMHDALFHSERILHGEPHARNVAMDYVVNTIITEDRKKMMSEQAVKALWGRRLGQPLPLAEFLSYIDGGPEVAKGPRVFVDEAVKGRSPESIYAEIMKHWEASPRKCPSCGALSMDPATRRPVPPGPCAGRPSCAHHGSCCGTCGALPRPGGGFGMGAGVPGSHDAHIPSRASKSKTQTDLMRAAARARTIARGSVPSEIEDALGRLSKPVLRFSDVMMSDCMAKSRDEGGRNDWKRIRRRWAAATPRQYLPHRVSTRMRWLAMLDTSGSMSDEDISFGISQLQALAARGSEGIVVPCDADVKWAAATRVNKMEDLRRTKVVGRGGTVFDDFFANFMKHLGTDFGTIAVITDGECGQVPLRLRPPVPVNWILTRKQAGWSQPFGRVLNLRVDHV